MGTSKLHEVIAIEKGRKSASTPIVTRLHRESKQLTRFNGFSKTYASKEEDGFEYPSEGTRIQLRVADQVRSFKTYLIELLDLAATKDEGNTRAKGDIIVDDIVVLANVPATTLLHIEKELQKVRTFLEDLPVLDPSESWNYDEARGFYVSDPSNTAKTRKVHRPIVLHPPTKEHPAQTQLVTEDQVIGTWTTVKFSAASNPSTIETWKNRTEKLLSAVKAARQRANEVEVENARIGTTILNYVFGADSA